MSLAVPRNVAGHLQEKVVGVTTATAEGVPRSTSTSPTETIGAPGLVDPAGDGFPKTGKSEGEPRDELPALWVGPSLDMSHATKPWCIATLKLCTRCWSCEER